MNVFGSNPVTAAAQARVASALTPQTLAPTTAVAKAAAATATKSSTGVITASDFLTLLVSELKNQDPTKPTDPTAYIQQLVGVNSLQQLIQINQGLTNIELPAPTTPPVAGS